MGRRAHTLDQCAAKFWARVSRGEGCWEWTGVIGSGGYGQMNFLGRSESAPRVAWRLQRGEIPTHLELMHSCDNRKCVRLEHLSLGTRLDNMRDKEAKGRGRVARGADQWKARLDNERVRAIRALYADGVSISAIARAFDVHTVTVTKIVKRITWKHVP